MPVHGVLVETKIKATRGQSPSLCGRAHSAVWLVGGRAPAKINLVFRGKFETTRNPNPVQSCHHPSLIRTMNRAKDIETDINCGSVQGSSVLFLRLAFQS